MKVNWKNVVIFVCKAVATILGAGAGTYTAMSVM